MPDITLVFVDCSRRTLSAAAARELCADPVLAGFIVDALTDDTRLQDALRLLIDGDDDNPL